MLDLSGSYPRLIGGSGIGELPEYSDILADRLERRAPAGTDTFTPAMRSTASTQPTNGNAVRVGRYSLSGDVCFVHGQYTMGSTSNRGGSGSIMFDLPLLPHQSLYQVISAWVIETGVQDLIAQARIEPTGEARVTRVAFLYSGVQRVLTTTYPTTFAAGSAVRFTGSYIVDPSVLP